MLENKKKWRNISWSTRSMIPQKRNKIKVRVSLHGISKDEMKILFYDPQITRIPNFKSL